MRKGVKVGVLNVQRCKYNTFGTMWCWSFNLFLLYFIVDILIIQPFEYGLC